MLLAAIQTATMNHRTWSTSKRLKRFKACLNFQLTSCYILGILQFIVSSLVPGSPAHKCGRIKNGQVFPSHLLMHAHGQSRLFTMCLIVVQTVRFHTSRDHKQKGPKYAHTCFSATISYIHDAELAMKQTGVTLCGKTAALRPHPQ